MNLLAIGNSEKLIRFIQSVYPISHVRIVSWRSLPVSIEEQNSIAGTNWDILLVAGYDYLSATNFYSTYYDKNVKNILHFANVAIAKDTLVIYINTMPARKRYTFSRYLFAKMALGKQLLDSFPQTICLGFPTMIESGKIATRGSFFSKFIFWLFYNFGYLSTVEINRSPEANLKLLTKLASKPIVPSPLLLRIPRPTIIDRLVRLILG